MSLYRFRFKVNPDDPRPVVLPKHPYWITGYSETYAMIVAYGDDEEYIKGRWPEASDIDKESVTGYVFNKRFPRPAWWGGAGVCQ